MDLVQPSLVRLIPNHAVLKQTRWGFYQYDPLPSEAILQQYYAERYYQEAHGSYEAEYSAEEVAYWQLKAWLIVQKSADLVSLGSGALVLDVGCGEGWYMDAFAGRGCTVRGFDFSRYAVQKFHPHLLPCLETGNVYGLLDAYIASGARVDVVILSNVIEHVLDPVDLLQRIRAILRPEGLLILHAPNDFSSIQEHLLARGYIPRRFWTEFPEHLSFFNKESIERLTTEIGYRLASVVADYPIEFLCFHEGTNYVRDPSCGKRAHCLRVRTENFLGSIDRMKLLEIRTILGSMGLGRGLTYYCVNT